MRSSHEPLWFSWEICLVSIKAPSGGRDSPWEPLERLSSKQISGSEVDSRGEKTKCKSSAIAGTATHEVTAISVPGGQ